KGVLDCVIHAERLLDALRAQAQAAGAALLDFCALASYKVGRGGVLVQLHQENGPVTLSGRVVLDGMGASSPHAAFDLSCPTVGGVLAGLETGTAPDQVDHNLGEILISTE